MSQNLSPQAFKEALEKHDEHSAFIDVRTPAEYRKEHIEGVENIPLDQLKKHIGDLSQKNNVYVHCKSGGRTGEACALLENYHLSNILRMEGGLDDWKQAGFTTVRGKGAIDLMRQVHIVAACMILLGLILNVVLDPLWLILPAIVGIGLLGQGLTGWCTMSLILSKMPWNR